MNRLQIPFLPSLINALILVSIFSTTNSFVFTASRAMFGMSQKGQAPKILGRVNKQGVPWVSVLFVLLIGCLSYLSISSTAVKFLDWWISLVGSAQLINWAGIGLYVYIQHFSGLFANHISIYLRFRHGLKVQNLLKTDILPIKGRLQPLSGWWLVIWAPVIFIFK